MLEDLEAVKKENQFTKAVDQLKHAIPSVLLVKGHNPLILLHKALSKGILEQTDKDCLEKATSIGLVLADLAERVGIALKDDKELSQVESNLMK